MAERNLDDIAFCIIKVGTRVLTHDDGTLDPTRIRSIVSQISQLVSQGKKVVLVSSGAVGAGMSKMNLTARPTELSQLQAIAAIGQAALVNEYQIAFHENQLNTAQVLLTADDFEDRKRYLNIRNTLFALLEYNVVPIVNENDTVAVEELTGSIGDNDQLAAQVTNLLQAPLMILLTNVDGLYDGDPNHTQSKRISRISNAEQAFDFINDVKNPLSRGGMKSKLSAAQLVASSGESVIIANGRTENILLDIFQSKDIGTYFAGSSKNVSSRKRWIGFTIQPRGTLTIDNGAVKAIRANGRSLLPIGIVSMNGTFDKGDALSIIDETGTEIARGLSNYSSADISKIVGLPSSRIAQVIGHCAYEEVIHRNSLTLT